MSSIPIRLEALEDRHPGLTSSIAEGYCEAAGVCFSRHHQSPIKLTVNRETDHMEVDVAWLEPDSRSKRAWANDTDTTESGAYAVALATVEVTDGLVAVSRAETRSGADYYLARGDSGLEDLEGSHRLEVSGVSGGGASDVRARLRQKIEQAKSGASNLPAIAAVVGFSCRVVAVSNVDDS